ncbi:MAG: EF-hand domain-containing protein [Nitrosomonadales bacterium]|nr:EF-hand domain-containing protein [Nitrosomonadales bacterium]
MKKTINYLAAASVLVLGATLAHADGEKCDSPMHNQSLGSKEGIMFNAVDTDSDGAISKTEFDAYYARHNAKHFMEIDANKDGKLTPDEMHGAQQQPAASGNGTTHLDQRFAAADADHSGGLDRKEAKDMPMLLQYFKEVDANKDGKVTRQEYFDAMPLLHSGKPMPGGKMQSL